MHRRVVDVGGGSGHLVRSVVAACSGVEGVLFDLPEVAGRLGHPADIEVVSGNFFTDELPGADCYVLMNIVHDWGDIEAVALLAAVARAGRPHDATILLIEALLPDGPEEHRAKTLDVMMLALTGGRERTLDEYDSLLADARLRMTGVTPTATSFSVIEATVVRLTPR